MIFGLFRAGPSPSTDALYAAIVSEARRVVFYAEYGVPDTTTARFDMVVLHLALVVRRLEAAADPNALLPAEGRRKPQTLAERIEELVDRFFADMDASLREMGVGDVAVPKRMTKLAGAWAGRARAYAAALADDDRAALVETLARNVFAAAKSRDGAGALAAHVVDVAAALAAQPLDRLLAGLVAWPDPAVHSPGIAP